jgi:undecaprenyl-diphosphatase
MNLEKPRRFWARRLARDDPLGFGLTLGVLLSLVALGGFAILAAAVQSQSGLVSFDQTVADHLHSRALAQPDVTAFFRFVTETGSPLVITLATVLIALLLYRRRRYLLTAGWVAGVAGGGLLVTGFKFLFHRPRPELLDPIVTEDTTSFPSGHSLGSLVAYGLLAYLSIILFPARRWRITVVTALAVWVLAIGFSRMYLGAHFFSDVLGGFSMGVCWLAVVITALEVVHRRRMQPRDSQHPH